MSDEAENDNYGGETDTQGRKRGKATGGEKHVNLKRRQKYDPRKAIEEAKKQQNEGKEIKSAFPEGFFEEPS